MKISDYKSLIDYISYSNMKYINPDKAGPDQDRLQEKYLRKLQKVLKRNSKNLKCRKSAAG